MIIIDALLILLTPLDKFLWTCSPLETAMVWASVSCSEKFDLWLEVYNC